MERIRSSDVKIKKQLDVEMQLHSLSFLQALQTVSEGWLKPGKVFPGINQSLALMPYWREGRRLKGQYTLVEGDLLPLASGAARGPIPLDKQGRCTSIAVGTYANDHHYPGKDWPLASKSCRWGGRWTGTPFCIPYGALLSSEVENILIADKAFSVSHIANGATRLQPMIFNLGQAAGMAAAIALKKRLQPAEVDISEIQHELLDDIYAPAAICLLYTSDAADE